MSAPSSTGKEILQCARHLIVKGGYNGFSYSDIAKIVGIRNASIHHHFHTKAELVRALLVGYRKDVESGLAGLERQSSGPLELLRAYVAIWAACITDGTAPVCICALLASEIPVLPEEVVFEVRAHFRYLSAWLTSVLERAAAQGSVRLQGTARQEAELFMATIHGAMMSARAYGDTRAFGDVAQVAVARLAA
ncbi:MAG: TetR/AcrR family transcriptional regulator [Candidatus Methylacidiphilales bacterium]|nr:TetR/AcrR family transcriptional regulator [Candidatus Methylacidiphilales bacterium]